MQRRVLVGLCSVLVLGGAATTLWWPPAAEQEEPRQGNEVEQGAPRSRRAHAPAAPIPAAPSRCDHPFLSVAAGMEWRYVFTVEGVTQEITFLAERVEPVGDGYRVRWKGTIQQEGEEYVHSFTTGCAPDGLVELPQEGLMRSMATDWSPPVCRYPTQLEEGLVVRDETSTEVGRIERTCTVTGVGVRVEVPASSFDAVVISMAELGSVGDREISTESTHWLAPRVGVVRSQLESGALELVRAP